MTRKLSTRRYSAPTRGNRYFRNAAKVASHLYNNRKHYAKQYKVGQGYVSAIQKWVPYSKKRKASKMSKLSNAGSNVPKRIGQATCKLSYDITDLKQNEFLIHWKGDDHCQIDGAMKGHHALPFGKLVRLQMIGRLPIAPADKVNILGEVTPSFVKFHGLRYNLAVFNPTPYAMKLKVFLIQDKYVAPSWLPEDIQYKIDKDPTKAGVAKIQMDSDFFKQGTMGQPIDFYDSTLSDLEKLNRPLSKRWRILHKQVITVKSNKSTANTTDDSTLQNFAVKNWYNKAHRVTMSRKFKYGKGSQEPTNQKVYMVCYAFPLAINPIPALSGQSLFQHSYPNSTWDAVSTPKTAEFQALKANMLNSPNAFFHMKYTSDSILTSSSIDDQYHSTLNKHETKNLHAIWDHTKKINALIVATTTPTGGTRPDYKIPSDATA